MSPVLTWGSQSPVAVLALEHQPGVPATWQQLTSQLAVANMQANEGHVVVHMQNMTD